MSGIVGQNLGRGSGLVKSGAIVADSVSGSEIADDAIDSEHYTDGSIDNAHIADDAIDSEHYADGSIDNAHIADDAIDSEHYADGSIDNAHIADDAIDSEHYTNASIDNAHLADNAVDTDEIADNAVTLAKMAGGTDGNIISFDASGDPVAIATGSDGQVLTSTGAGSPPAFEAAAGGGKVGQVIQNNVTDGFLTTTSATPQTTNIDVQITPVATSSKVLLIFNFSAGVTTANKTVVTNIFVDTTTEIFEAEAAYANVGTNITGRYSVVYLHSPSTTSEKNYELKLACNQGDASVYIYGSSTNITTATAIEILA